MATAVAEEISKKTKDYAQKVKKKLEDLTSRFIPDYWEISETISEIHEKSVWQILGFETRDSFREQYPISKGSWYERKKLWEEWAARAIADEKITRAQLNRLASQNVKQLLRLGDKRMFAASWITKALTLTETKLTEAVDHVLLNEDDVEEGAPEAKCMIKWECTTSQKQAINLVIEDFAHRQGIDKDDKPYTLIMMLADYRAGWPETGKIVEEN